MTDPSPLDFLEMIRQRADQTKRDLDKAIQELTAMQERKNSLQVKFAELQRQEGFWAAEVGEFPELQDVQTPEFVNEEQPNRPRTRAIDIDGPPRVGAGVALADLAGWILEDEGRVMRAGDIATRIVEIGHPMPDDPQAQHNSVYSAMWRRKDTFKKAGGGFWDLVKR